MAVEMRHLRALVAVADAGGFTAAGETLGLSQAAVSRAIGQLERELATTLAHRTTRRVELTEAGRGFLADARRTLASLDAATSALRGDAQTIRVGYAWAALGSHTTAALRGWNRANPLQPLRMVRINSRDAGLAEALVDVAVVRNPVADPAIEGVAVGREARVCAVAVDHPLARRRGVGLGDLLDYPVATDRASGTTNGALWLDRGHPSPPLVTTNDVDEWLDLIAAGDAIGVSTTATADQYPRPGVVFLPLTDAPRIEVRLVWHRAHRHPATDRLARHLAAAYRAS